MSKPDTLSKPAVALDHDSTLVCVIEMSGTSWLVAATVPGVDRRPLQRLPVNPERLLEQVERWRQEAARAGRTITHTVVVYESGRDGFWLARGSPSPRQAPTALCARGTRQGRYRSDGPGRGTQAA